MTEYDMAEVPMVRAKDFWTSTPQIIEKHSLQYEEWQVDAEGFHNCPKCGKKMNLFVHHFEAFTGKDAYVECPKCGLAMRTTLVERCTFECVIDTLQKKWNRFAQSISS